MVSPLLVFIWRGIVVLKKAMPFSVPVSRYGAGATVALVTTVVGSGKLMTGPLAGIEPCGVTDVIVVGIVWLSNRL